MGFKISVETISPPNFQRSHELITYDNNIGNLWQKSIQVLRGIFFVVPGHIPLNIPFLDVLALVKQFFPLAKT
jgi:hypothetical protein